MGHSRSSARVGEELGRRWEESGGVQEEWERREDWGRSWVGIGEEWGKEWARRGGGVGEEWGNSSKGGLDRYEYCNHFSSPI